MFSSKDHIKALGAKDVWAVVGWSGDLVPAAERSGDVELVAPASGTALWADVWTVPSHAEHGSRVLTGSLSFGIVFITGSAKSKPEAMGHTCRASAAASAGFSKVCSLTLTSQSLQP